MDQERTNRDLRNVHLERGKPSYRENSPVTNSESHRVVIVRDLDNGCLRMATRRGSNAERTR